MEERSALFMHIRKTSSQGSTCSKSMAGNLRFAFADSFDELGNQGMFKTVERWHGVGSQMGNFKGGGSLG